MTTTRTRTLRVLMLAPLLLLTGAKGAAKYDAGLLKLASGVAAKEVCSCLFIMEMDEAWCQEWTRVSPDISKFKVDYDEKTVKSRALLARSSARYIGAREGCVIEE